MFYWPAAFWGAPEERAVCDQAQDHMVTLEGADDEEDDDDDGDDDVDDYNVD